MNDFRRMIYLLLLMIPMSVFAQEGFHVDTLFRAFGQREGSTMTIMNKSALKGLNFNYYQSLVMSYNEEEMQLIQRCLNADRERAAKIKEVISEGMISKGYYFIQPEKGRLNHFILFDNLSKQQCLLIYIKSTISSEQMMEQLK